MRPNDSLDVEARHRATECDTFPLRSFPKAPKGLGIRFSDAVERGALTFRKASREGARFAKIDEFHHHSSERASRPCPTLTATK